MISSPFLIVSEISTRSLAFSSDQHGLHAARAAARSFSLSRQSQHAPAQRDLAGHGDVAAHRNSGHNRDDRRDHGDTGRRTILGVAPSGTCTWMSRLSNSGGSMPKATARERT